MSLRIRAFSAVRWTALGTILSSLLQIAQIAILARLLSPEDYGLMAIVTAILGFAAIFSDFGVSSAFIHKRNVTEHQRSSLFWLNLLISTLVVALIFMAGPLLDAFFDGEGRLRPLLSLTSLTFLVSALGIQVRMAAEKNLHFRSVMLIEVAAAFVSFFTAVWTASAGSGVYSLVYGAIAKTSSSTILLWLVLANGWRPEFRCQMQDVRPFIGFGARILLSNIVNQISTAADLILGGRALPADQLGYYVVPRDLTVRQQFLVNRIVTRVAFPLISELQQDIDRVRSMYLRALNMTASVNAPILVVVAFFSSDIVEVLLGGTWAISGDILRTLAIWAYLRSVANPVGSLLMGLGQTSLAMKWNCGLLLITPTAIWIGITQAGVEGIATALLGVYIVLYFPLWFILVRPLCQAGLVAYAEATLWPAVLATGAGFLAFTFAALIDSSLVRLIVGALACSFIYAVFSYFGNRQWLVSVLEFISKTGEQPRA